MMINKTSPEHKTHISIKSDEISLKELIQRFINTCNYILSKWLTIIIIVALGGVIGGFYAQSKKANYIAETTFVLEGGGTSSGNLGGIASMVGLNIGGDGVFQADNVLEMYKSRTIIENTLLSEIDYNGKKELIVDRYINFNGLRHKWAENPNLKDLTFSNNAVRSRLQDSVLGEIVKNISSNYLIVEKLDKKPSIIKVRVEAPNEFFAKAFNDNIVKNVNDFYINTKTQKSLENVIILQQKVDSVKSVLNNNIFSAAAIADATPNLNPTRQAQRVAPMQRSQFSAEANKNILIELVKNLELSKITLRKETPLIQVLDIPVYPLEATKFSTVKGAVIGGVLGLIVACLYLIFRRIVKSNLSSVVIDEK
jgi:uncharacterized membrane protein